MQGINETTVVTRTLGSFQYNEDKYRLLMHGINETTVVTTTLGSFQYNEDKYRLLMTL